MEIVGKNDFKYLPFQLYMGMYCGVMFQTMRCSTRTRLLLAYNEYNYNYSSTYPWLVHASRSGYAGRCLTLYYRPQKVPIAVDKDSEQGRRRRVIRSCGDQIGQEGFLRVLRFPPTGTPHGGKRRYQRERCVVKIC